ncbi:MAG TPA: hypothetical protein VF057_03600, partial [Thermoanaerobaculia bacterium]
MRSILRFAIVFALTTTSATAVVVRSDRAQQELSLNPRGVVVIENIQGYIEVVGGDGANVVVTADRTIHAADANALSEAQRVVHRVLEGNDKLRIIRTVAPAGPSPRWNAQVNYTISVPRTASVKIN